MKINETKNQRRGYDRVDEEGDEDAGEFVNEDKSTDDGLPILPLRFCRKSIKQQQQTIPSSPSPFLLPFLSPISLSFFIFFIIFFIFI